MRHALTMALQSFTGGLIVVSHDRALLAATTDDFWLVHDGKVAPFDGDLDDYRQFRVQQMASASAENKILNSQNKQLLRQEAADKRAQIAVEKKPLLKALADIEKKIAPLSAKKAELDGYLATEGAYLPENKATLAESVRKQALYAAELADFEGQWLLIQEELEALDAASLALED
jgi:ATP-binding cassette subfamily F protein 3